MATPRSRSQAGSEPPSPKRRKRGPCRPRRGAWRALRPTSTHRPGPPFWLTQRGPGSRIAPCECRCERRPVGAGPGGDAEAGVPDGRHARGPGRRRVRPATDAGHSRRDGDPPRRTPAGRRRVDRADPGGARRGCAAVHESRRAPALLCLRALVWHLAGCARRPRGQRLQRVRRVLDGVGRPQSGGARAARLVQGLDRLSAGVSGCSPERGIGGQHDRSGLRP